MASTPIFAQSPLSTALQVSGTLNSSRAQVVGIPSSSIALTPAPPTPNGIRVDQITVTALGTTVAGIIIIWLYDGTNSNPILEIPVTAITPNTTTTTGFSATVYPTNLVIAPACRLYATSTVASQPVAVGVFGGMY